MRIHTWSIPVAVLALAVYWFGFSRDSGVRSYDLVLDDGSTAVATVSTSRRRFFGHPHVFSWGGGHREIELEVLLDGRAHRWSGTTEDPVLVQRRDGELYLVIAEGWRDYSRRGTFVVLRWDGATWAPTDQDSFPRDLAWGNLRNQRWHESTWTARLWVYLEGDNPAFSYDWYGRRYFPERWVEYDSETKAARRTATTP